MSSDADKTALRVRLRGVRRRLAEEIPDAAQRALRWFPATRFARFRTVAAYWAQGSEMNPRPLLDAILALEPGKIRAALPVAVDRKSALKFRLWRPNEPLAPDAFGIPSPPPTSEEVLPNLVITPLLAFDRKGGRLGQGAGHYDRTIKTLKAQRAVFVLGLAYAGQELKAVPMAPHDQRLDAILTETAYIEVARS
jgi:5-formyltetrahydrofolate cyclo-ligase